MIIFLETPRLIIKKPSLKDCANWQQLHSNEAVMKFICEIPTHEINQQWLEHDIAHFKKHGFSMGSVYEKQSGQFIGRSGLVYFDYDDTQPEIEVGFVLKPEFWHKGYAVEL